MLKIDIPGYEFYDEVNNEFITKDSQSITFEHSLISLSKWEMRWNKPFLSSDKNNEEILDYIKCMNVNSNVSDEVYLRLTNDNLKTINDYINAPMTATTFNERNTKSNREVVTSELIYYWMISFNIPMECQKWHINRLLTLIKVCNIKNSPPDKMSKQDLMRRNRQLNAERRKQLNSKG